MVFNDCIIMAGGSGTRLWPASNTGTPKQFLPIPGAEAGYSFFDAALERALALFDREGDGRVIIIAGQGHVRRVAEACAKLKPGDLSRVLLIPEPAARNTAPAIACGALYAELALGGGRTVLVLTSDHIIKPPDLFRVDAAAAAAFAREDNLVVFGIPPRSPETGYGYLEAAGPAEPSAAPPSPAGPPGPPVFRVAAFREKPDRETAERFLAEKRFYWNSGMFAFSSRFILGEFRRSAPAVFAPFEGLRPPGEDACRTQGGLRILAGWPGLAEAYAAVKPISFDYAIAEKCRRTVMVAAGFEWYDVGSWDEYSVLASAGRADAQTADTASPDTGPADAAPAAPKPSGPVYRSDAENCFADSDIPLALCGVRDLIVVVRSGKDGSPPAVLIAKRGQTQRVRDIVEQIKTSGRTDLL
ncbi:MAG: mannose-1-phosphate guanylyltransferase [Treponema sp.]|jgi:mannose-1-phosphate guanylyltransferase/mannose-1-phosphate guanylyltransferase/mannose-6-phosphate isomerase|nr:mannose-1-phosphate guanylyltransferase [Treponema sp.]